MFYPYDINGRLITWRHRYCDECGQVVASYGSDGSNTYSSCKCTIKIFQRGDNMSGIIEKMQAEIDDLKRKVDRLEGRNIPYIAPKIDWTKLGKALQSVAKATEERKKPKPTRAEIVARAKEYVRHESLEVQQNLLFPKFIVNTEKRTIVCLLERFDHGVVNSRGIAKCAPDDCFNVHIGKAIALRRALGEEIPDEYLNAPAPEGVEVGDLFRMDGWGSDSSKTVIVQSDRNPRPLTEVRIRVAAMVLKNKHGRVIDDSARY